MKLVSPLFVWVKNHCWRLFCQLLTSSAVHKWGTEIHEGIYNMLMLLVDLVAERVRQEPVPVGLMSVLTMVGLGRALAACCWRKLMHVLSKYLPV